MQTDFSIGLQVLRRSLFEQEGSDKICTVLGARLGCGSILALTDSFSAMTKIPMTQSETSDCRDLCPYSDQFLLLELISMISSSFPCSHKIN